MHKKFEINWTKIKGGSQWGRKVVPHNSKSDLPLDPSTMDQGYPDFGKFLNATGRPIVYSCSWPDYQLAEGQEPNYKLIAEHCNLWRNFDDIDDSWDSVLSIIDYYGNPNTSNSFAPFSGPGHWYLYLGSYLS